VQTDAVIGLTKLAAGSGHVALSDRPERVLEPGQVRIAVHAAGICGTDLHIEAGEYACVPPVTMGHELCGVVAELGADVDNSWLGERVVAETYFSTCGSCRSCRAGRINLCPDRRSIGSYADGAFATSVIVPAVNLHRAPERLPSHAAALTEPLACVCQSLLDPTVVAEGDRVLVIGPGAVGLIAAQVARSLGGDVEVRGTARDALRLELARGLGLVSTEAGDDHDYDVVIECSGSAGGIATGLTSARRGGRVVQIGLRGAPVEVPFDEICFRELTVSSGNASTPRSWERALELLEDGRVELEPLITEVVPLGEWERAFEASRSAAGVKFVLDPR
jgi:L-iditol 2-dehydrogenase